MKQTHALVIASTAGLAVGATTGYFVAKAMLTKKYQEISDAEILEVKKHYNMVFDPKDYNDPEEAAQADRQRTSEYLAQLDQFGYSDDAPVEESSPVPAEETTEEPSEVEEAPAPIFDEDYPFPITAAEFLNDEEDYSKLTITYYNEDDTLADERNEVITDVPRIIGNCHKKFMGFDPSEPFIVYVRNHNMKADYEVLLDHGSYLESVMGVMTDVGE